MPQKIYVHLHTRHARGGGNSFYALQFPYHNREKETGQGHFFYALCSINLLHIYRTVIKNAIHDAFVFLLVIRRPSFLHFVVRNCMQMASDLSVI
jgi:hypothetical protein